MVTEDAPQKRSRKAESPLKPFIDALRDELIAKLTDDWADKWAARHGDSFEGLVNIPVKETFLDELAIDIVDTIEARWGKVTDAKARLSNDTLGRFLNENPPVAPGNNTREVMARYVGFDSFSHFQEQHRPHAPPPIAHTTQIVLFGGRREILPTHRNPTIIQLLSPRPVSWRVGLGLGLAALLAWAGYYYTQVYRPNRTLTPAEIAGLSVQVAYQNHVRNPAKVTISYDFSRLGIDSIRLRFGANRGISEHNEVILTQPAGTYTFDFYKPGMHPVSVYHRHQLLKSVYVYVQSHGWACWYETPGWVNTNFPYRKFYRDGMLFFHPDEFQNPSHRNNYVLSMLLAQRLPITTDSLRVEYDIKYSPDDYAISCYEHALILGFSNDAQFAFTTARNGCNEFSHRNQPPKKETDFNGYSLMLPRLFYDWTHLKYEWKAGRLRIWAGNELLTDSPNNVPNGQLISLGFNSKGSAMYDNVRISNSYTGRPVFTDDFTTLPKSTDGY